MAYLIGTDEAGYGPNLGPLVISATLWEVPDGVGVENLFNHLGHVIAPELRRQAGNAAPSPIVMADSKAIYSPDKGLRHLERGLWAAMAQWGHCPRTWRGVWLALAPAALDSMPIAPWYRDYDAPAPSAHDAAELDATGQQLREGLASAGVRLAAVRSRAIFAHEFNELVDRHLLKSTALSHETLALAAGLIEPLPAGPISVVCDKHGGRNRYAPFLAEHFPDSLVEVYGEGRERSVYRFGPSKRRVEVCFRMKAESCLPAALASMASKYLRELAMQAFNEYWRGHVPGLQPTAGYPQDARRFRIDIAETQRRLHVDDRVLWRER